MPRFSQETLLSMVTALAPGKAFQISTSDIYKPRVEGAQE